MSDEPQRACDHTAGACPHDTDGDGDCHRCAGAAAADTERRADRILHGGAKFPEGAPRYGYRGRSEPRAAFSEYDAVQSIKHLRERTNAGHEPARLFELARHDAMVAHFVNAWRAGYFRSFEHMLLALVVEQARQTAELRKEVERPVHLVNAWGGAHAMAVDRDGLQFNRGGCVSWGGKPGDAEPTAAGDEADGRTSMKLVDGEFFYRNGNGPWEREAIAEPPTIATEPDADNVPAAPSPAAGKAADDSDETPGDFFRRVMGFEA